MKKNKKKKKVKFIYKIIVGLLFLITILFIIGLMCLNVLSMKWFMLVVGIILFIDFLFWLFIIKSRIRKISSAVAFIFMFILSLGSFYIFKTTGLFSGMSSNYKTYNYSVVVLKESGYSELGDLDNQLFGYLKSDTEEIDQSLKHIKDKISVKYEEYDDVNTLINKLFDKKVEAVLLEDSYLKMFSEDNSKFNSDTVVIYTFRVKVEIEDFSKDVNVVKEPFNIYVSGIDTYGSVDSVSRSDVNMVISVNPVTKQILMTSIPRDYYVTLHGVSGYGDKLTHAGLYGVDMSVKTIEDLLDIEINYYVKVNFTSVTKIVDALGGVDVYSEYAFTSIDGYNYSKGYNKVSGEEALSFARERKAFASGDNQRIKNQQALLQAMFKKCISKEMIYKYNKLLDGVDGSFVTNMSADRITSLIRMQLKDMANWTITSNSLKGSDSSNYTYSYASQKLYVMEPLEESVEEATNLINAVFDGDVLENSYDEKTGNSHIVTKSSNNSKKPDNSLKVEKKEDEKEDKVTSKVETSKTVSSDDKKNDVEDVVSSTVISSDDVPPVDDEDNSKDSDKIENDFNEEIDSNSSVKDDNNDSNEKIENDIEKEGLDD